MAKKDKIQMPQSTAGLIRYFDSSNEKLKLKPEHIAIACGAVIALEIVLKLGIF